MTSEELDIAFRAAVESINEHTEPFPADFLLRLYAYYKRATDDQDLPSSNNPLISAFKTNALFQTKDLSSDEAKQLYVEAVNHYFLYRK
ncbi:acyl-CoA-binding protein [Aequorivita soesokkakensis]|jgi:acyl-CoA-binding protein|uniref:Acyl-CoA-binding protein n=1 Tax=Aequorivita soesokkakensis TaxID=1385699 RepID=A0A1A9LGK7_9FLAO|nr:acyl-CoA-binding protein [Aequorivita soesokkakensis]OAD92237.1 acyl-CoA-binding protein [Aequorivita soesokkakensis]